MTCTFSNFWYFFRTLHHKKVGSKFSLQPVKVLYSALSLCPTEVIHPDAPAWSTTALCSAPRSSTATLTTKSSTNQLTAMQPSAPYTSATVGLQIRAACNDKISLVCVVGMVGKKKLGCNVPKCEVDSSQFVFSTENWKRKWLLATVILVLVTWIWL